MSPQVGAVGYEPGDLFLLCTDGLVEGLYDEQILEILRPAKRPRAGHNPANQLVNEALAKDGRDNTTAVVIPFGGNVGNDQSSARSTYTQTLSLVSLSLPLKKKKKKKDRPVFFFLQNGGRQAGRQGSLSGAARQLRPGLPKLPPSEIFFPHPEFIGKVSLPFRPACSKHEAHTFRIPAIENFLAETSALSQQQIQIAGLT